MMEYKRGLTYFNKAVVFFSKICDIIYNKSSVVDMRILYGRGDVDTPVRIRIA